MFGQITVQGMKDLTFRVLNLISSCGDLTQSSQIWGPSCTDFLDAAVQHCALCAPCTVSLEKRTQLCVAHCTP